MDGYARMERRLALWAVYRRERTRSLRLAKRHEDRALLRCIRRSARRWVPRPATPRPDLEARRAVSARRYA